jgi:phage head maturation protease
VDDGHGPYLEVIDPTAWNKRLADVSRSKAGLRAVAVFYHHGHTLYDTPSELGSFPVGHPLAIRADAHGLLTSTHYGTSDIGEQVLTMLKDGDLTGHSFTGRIVRSDPPRVPRASRAGELPRVRRLELGLDEYGATPMPVYAGAQAVAARAASLAGPPADDGPSQADIERKIRLAAFFGTV